MAYELNCAQPAMRERLLLYVYFILLFLSLPDAVQALPLPAFCNQINIYLYIDIFKY